MKSKSRSHGKAKVVPPATQELPTEKVGSKEEFKVTEPVGFTRTIAAEINGLNKGIQKPGTARRVSFSENVVIWEVSRDDSPSVELRCCGLTKLQVMARIGRGAVIGISLFAATAASMFWEHVDALAAKPIIDLGLAKLGIASSLLWESIAAIRGQWAGEAPVSSFGVAGGSCSRRCRRQPMLCEVFQCSPWRLPRHALQH